MPTNTELFIAVTNTKAMLEQYIIQNPNMKPVLQWDVSNLKRLADKLDYMLAKAK